MRRDTKARPASGRDPPDGVGEPDVHIRQLAAVQHGVVGRRQLLDAGVPVYAIDNRVRNGRLEPLHRGVYRVGPLRGRLEREMAAVLACGEGALLSHRSAVGLWSLTPSPGGDVPVEVSVQGRRPDYGSGVRVHRVRSMEADERTAVDGVPVTTPERTSSTSPPSWPPETWSAFWRSRSEGT